MGVAPRQALTESTTPNDITNTEATVSGRSFANFGRSVTGRDRASDTPKQTPPDVRTRVRAHIGETVG